MAISSNILQTSLKGYAPRAQSTILCLYSDGEHDMQLHPAFILLTAIPTLASGYQPRLDLDEGRYLKALEEAEAQLKGNPASALAWAAKAQALTAMMRLPEALAASEKALALKPGLADALLARGQARGGQAVAQRNLGSLRVISAAMEDLRAAAQADPTLSAAWMTLGLGYEQLPGILGGSVRKALACAASLRKLNPARGDVLEGTILAMEGRWAEAEPVFRRAIAAAPRDPEVVYGYLEALGSREVRKPLGEGPQKQRQVSDATRLLPGIRTRARAVAAVCDALLDADRPEEAWAVAKEALPGVDAPSLLRLGLGKIAARSGKHLEEGLAVLDQVLREPLEGGTGGYATAHWRRGQVLKGLGRKDEARRAAEAALRLDPKDPKAARLLEELR
jgi:tetratricopeptide (TPR) repeat protein